MLHNEDNICAYTVHTASQLHKKTISDLLCIGNRVINLCYIKIT